MNGISPGDRIVIVDDTIGTGGKLAALIEAVQMAGASVGAVLFAVEKVDNRSAELIRSRFGIEVKSRIQGTIDPWLRRTRVVSQPGRA
ncbi:hypothetical protein WMF26_40055 [Sorangium sp. So ce185]|uniref:hypothetical protein n=1 Tax=Sorangium sp. So ce185 TaxID=3133287 RepID=UPI003F5E6DB7